MCGLQRHRLSQGARARPRYVYDYELELILEGSGFQHIDDRLYPVQKGDVLFRTPGTSRRASCA